MAVVDVALRICFVSVMFLEPILSYNIPIAKIEEYDAVECVNQILIKNYKKGSELTFIDMSEGNDGIILEIHRKLHVSVISRTANQQLSSQNEGYIIYAKTFRDFDNFFKYLTKDAEWNPTANFVIVVGDSEENKLMNFFDTLLVYHVINVVIVNGIHDPDVYTYNPFDNYGCGRTFHGTIHYGKCKNPVVTNFFPNKLITGLRNCTINVAAPHWPPYSIDPSTNISKVYGIEQFVFQTISEIEDFQINYTYNNDAEQFTVISDEMSAVGPMRLLQNNEADVILGGMMLIKSRADAFDYIYSHLAFIDEIKIMVKKAGTVELWKNVYLEFHPTVWMLLIVSFMIYFVFLIIIVREKDKGTVLLKMWDSLLVHGSTIGNKPAVKCAFIMWIWFAYLINSYYQCNLVSLSTHPAMDYQVSSEQDLVDYHLRPCVSLVIQTWMLSELEKPLDNITDDCKPLLQSIRTVSHRDDLFTVVIYSVYLYHKFNYFDRYGRSPLYEFPTMNKIVYAMYFYKGFPFHRKFHYHALRLRESGLIGQIIKDLYFEENIRHYFQSEGTQFNIVIPWFIYLSGICISTFVFAVEVLKIEKKHFVPMRFKIYK